MMINVYSSAIFTGGRPLCTRILLGQGSPPASILGIRKQTDLAIHWWRPHPRAFPCFDTIPERVRFAVAHTVQRLIHSDAWRIDMNNNTTQKWRQIVHNKHVFSSNKMYDYLTSRAGQEIIREWRSGDGASILLHTLRSALSFWICENVSRTAMLTDAN